MTIAAHSLGNMVASNAIAEYGMAPDRYYMINAAVAIEAYDIEQMKSNSEMQRNMTEEDWYEYPPKVYASNWHKVFENDDPRQKLTWKDRFSDVVQYAYNFYSPGDDVVENAGPNEEFGTSIWNAIVSGDFGRHAWVGQEIAKGGQFILACTSLTFSHCQGGWKFNTNDDDLNYIGKVELQGDNDHEVNVKLSAQEVDDAFENNILTNEHIAQFGFFSRFEDEYHDLYAPIIDGNELRPGGPNVIDAKIEALNLETQWRLLGHAIPAQSYAAAANAVGRLNDFGKRNFNMPDLRDEAGLGWPQERITGGPFDLHWLHSDFRNVAMPYVFPVYENMLDIGGLRENSP